jgi:transcriptional regulator with XRE-family HTH domain
MVAHLAKRKPKRTTQFGQRLRALREAAGLSQAELGERAGGIAAQNIAKYERGVQEPNWPTVLDLAEALGIATDEFRDKPAKRRK